MRIILHIGCDQCGAGRVQSVLAAQRDRLTARGIRFASSPGKRNHTRLWMAVTDPDHIDPLRAARGYAAPDAQARLRAEVVDGLGSEVAAHTPDMLILSAAQLCWLARPSELNRLRNILTPLSSDIQVVAHVDEPAAVLARVYAEQVLEGRARPLARDVALAPEAEGWWEAALNAAPRIDLARGVFAETQGAPFWLDYTRLVRHWENVFGAGSVHLTGYEGARLNGAQAARDIEAAFGLSDVLAEAPAVPNAEDPSEAWLVRARHFNALLLKMLARNDKTVPRRVWRAILEDMQVPGAPLEPARLADVSRRFADQNARLAKRHTGLQASTFRRPRPKTPKPEAAPDQGFRASQYLLAHMWQIDRATRARGTPTPGATDLSETARAVMPQRGIDTYYELKNSRFAPHNSLGTVDETTLGAPYTALPARVLPEGTTGTVVVACMKNEAPYITEWIAYHRSIGVDSFLIYTNDCTDGTDALLDRLQDMGVLHHRTNDAWTGNSPQQHALNRALKEPVVQQAQWVIHIDVDEFINVRCGNGTLTDLKAAVPDATQIAMTWRMFGHNGVTEITDGPVIEQFDACAPKFCPKPHTAWGFKTISKNTRAYGKYSCHRPNKLDDAHAGRVKWVNGSGQDMTRETLKNGWRNSQRSIGYDLVQLNHYALRSADSFLVKRARGRALHVDRTIGLNYWIRMDWNDHIDVTIQRNVPRMRDEYSRLMQDSRLRALHVAGLAWHRAKAAELHGAPEFQELFDSAMKIKLTAMERVAYALALDMES